MPYVPTQAELLARNRVQARARTAKNYQGLVGLAVGAAGLALSFTDLPLGVSIGLMIVGLASAALLRRV